jgi:ribulose 1,5-bisphosphate carboxylase large subunit-like protein
VEAVLAGKTLQEAARSSPELRKSLELWANIRFDVQQ